MILGQAMTMRVLANAAMMLLAQWSVVARVRPCMDSVDRIV
jgi:hypothetical protein